MVVWGLVLLVGFASMLLFVVSYVLFFFVMCCVLIVVCCSSLFNVCGLRVLFCVFWLSLRVVVCCLLLLLVVLLVACRLLNDLADLWYLMLAVVCSYCIVCCL